MTKMTIEELKGKSDEELVKLRKDGAISWNEFLLAENTYAKEYLKWLDGEEPCDEAADAFLKDNPDNDDVLLWLEGDGLIGEKEFYFYSGTYHDDYVEWLDGREPTEENASEFANYEDERME